MTRYMSASKVDCILHVDGLVRSIWCDLIRRLPPVLSLSLRSVKPSDELGLHISRRSSETHSSDVIIQFSDGFICIFFCNSLLSLLFISELLLIVSDEETSIMMKEFSDPIFVKYNLLLSRHARLISYYNIFSFAFVCLWISLSCSFLCLASYLVKVWDDTIRSFQKGVMVDKIFDVPINQVPFSFWEQLLLTCIVKVRCIILGSSFMITLIR